MVGANAWVDFASALAVVVVGGGIAALWPAIQRSHRGRKFESIIKRELQEVGPHPKTPTPDKPSWSDYLEKKFVHEVIFKRDNISQNRDFLLSLDPTVVYLVSQLWIEFEKRNADQWIYYLTELSNDPKVGQTKQLRDALTEWETLLAADRTMRLGAATFDAPRST